MITREEVENIAQSLGITKLGFTTVDRLSGLPTGKILDIFEHRAVLDVFPRSQISDHPHVQGVGSDLQHSRHGAHLAEERDPIKASRTQSFTSFILRSRL